MQVATGGPQNACIRQVLGNSIFCELQRHWFFCCIAAQPLLKGLNLKATSRTPDGKMPHDQKGYRAGIQRLCRDYRVKQKTKFLREPFVWLGSAHLPVLESAHAHAKFCGQSSLGKACIYSVFC